MDKQRSINKEQLMDLIKKYKIGKKPLSKLLGWGETTVLLYSAMDEVPDNEYTERLYQLYIDKGQYLEVLLQNRSNITDIAFRKSLKAIHEPIFESKILVVAQYIIDINKRAGTLYIYPVTCAASNGHLDIVKLLYLCNFYLYWPMLYYFCP